MDDPKAIQTYLGLENTPTSVVNVVVPAGTKMQVGRIGSQPSFGLMENSGFQYQLMDYIPEKSFVDPRALSQPVSQNTVFNPVYSSSPTL